MFSTLRRLLGPIVVAASILPTPLLASGVAQSVIPVTAIVQPSAAVKLQVVPISLSISTEDIARGYIDIPVGSLLSVKAGQALPPVIIDFSMGDGMFRSVEVRDSEQPKVEFADSQRRTDAPTEDSGLTKKSELSTNSPDSGQSKISPESNQLASSNKSDGSAAIAYRFRLSDRARPGNYQVPIVVNITF